MLGLPAAAFGPDDQICALRSYLRQREMLAPCDRVRRVSRPIGCNTPAVKVSWHTC
jgi:hypothetical protein